MAALKMATWYRFLTLAAFSIALAMAGCGESTKDAMMRVARQRAQAKEAEAAEEKAKADAAAAAPQPDPAVAAQSPAAPAPAATTAPVANPNTTPSNTAAAVAPAPAAAPAVAAVAPPAVNLTPALPTPDASSAGQYPINTNHLLFDPTGHAVAYSGEGNTIGVQDVATKTALRNAYNSQLTPSSIAVDEQMKQLVVGGSEGGFKVFALGSVKGLDRYAQERVIRRDRDTPVKAHAHPVTAVATTAAGKAIATADAAGEVRLWSSESVDPSEYSGAKSGFVAIKNFQRDQLLFAATKLNKILFWKDGKNSQPAEFASLNNRPLVLQAGPGGKGLAIGDDLGKITFWEADGSDLKKQSFQAHSQAISGLSFLSHGESLITASRGGELFRWRLPLNTAESIELREPPRFLTVSNSGRLIAVPSRKNYLDVYTTNDRAASRSFKLPNERRVAACAFAGEGGLTAVADDGGAIHFYANSEQPFASLVGQEFSIEQLSASPDSSMLAAAWQDGTIGVTRFPSLNLEFARISPAQFAVSDASGTTLLSISQNFLEIIGSDAVTQRALRYSGPNITAAYVDSAMALVATSAGEVKLWRYIAENAELESVRAPSGKPILGIGLTKYGQIWSCDAEGNCLLNTLQGASSETASVTGKLDRSIEQISVADDGLVATLDTKGLLSIATALQANAQPVTGPSATGFASIQAGGSSVWALAGDKRRLLQVKSDGSIQASVAVAEQHGDITRFSAHQRGVACLTQNGSLLSYVAAEGRQRSSSKIGTSGLTSAVVSGNGKIVWSRSTEGLHFLSDRTGRVKRLKLDAAAQVLALSTDGQLALVVGGPTSACFDLRGETPKPILEFPDDQKPVAGAFTSNGRAVFVATADGKITRRLLSDANQAEAVFAVEGQPAQLVLNPQDDRLILRNATGRLWLVRLGSKAEPAYDSQQTSYSAVAVTSDRVILGDANGAIHELKEGESAPRVIATVSSQSIITLHCTGVSCLAESKDRQVHSIDLREKTWASHPASTEGNALVLALAGDEYLRLDSQGNVVVTAAAALQPLSSSAGNARQVAATQDGRWIVACDSAGKLTRWSVQAKAGDKGAPSTLPQAVSDLSALGEGGNICLLTPAGLAEYSPAADRVVSVIKSKFNGDSRISATGRDRTAVITSSDRRQLADFAAGVLATIDAVDTSTRFAQLGGASKQNWYAVNPDGSFRSITPNGATKGDGSDSFRLPIVPNIATYRGESMLVQSGSQAILVRADGATMQSAKSSSGQILLSAVGNGNALATVDSARRLSFVGSGPAEKNFMVPGTFPIVGLVWSLTGQDVAISSDQEIYIVDSQTARLKATYRTPNAIKSLIHWSNTGLWCLGSDQRLFRIKVPQILWSEKLATPAKVVAWQQAGSEVLFGTTRGELSSFQANTGNVIAKVDVGKRDLRAVCKIPNSKRLVLLSDTASLSIFDDSRQLNPLAISSGLPLVDIACDSSGRLLFACNNVGEIFYWDMTDLDAPAKTLPCEQKCTALRVVEGGQMAAIGPQPLISILPIGGGQETLVRTSSPIEEMAVMPDDAFAAIADGSSVVQLIGLKDKQNYQLTGNSVGFRTLAIHPRGLRVAAAGNSIGRSGAKLVLWDTNGLKNIAEIDLAGKPRRIVYSRDGGLIAVPMEDGTCPVHDGSSGALLETIPAMKELNCVEFSEDGRRLLMAKEDGSVRMQPLFSMGVVQASASAVTAMLFHDSGKMLWVGDALGKLSLRSISNLSKVVADVQGASGKILQTKLSNDSRFLAAVYDDAEHSTLVWKLQDTPAVPSTSAPDIIIRNPETRTTAVAFTVDAQYVLLGGEDGLIRAWSIAENREVARFRGHTGPLQDIAGYLEPGRFVSGSVDRSIRTWRFPATLPRAGDPVPEGALVEGSEMQRVTVPNQTVKEEDERMAAARQALITGSPNDRQVGEIYSLLNSDTALVAEATASHRRLKALESDPNASIEDIYTARRRNSQLRSKIDASGRSGNQASFASGFENAVMQARTEFLFDALEATRPVKLCFDDRFLYAARPSVPPKPVNPEAPPPPASDNGSLLSWEYRVTQLPSREWSVSEINVQEIFALPNSTGIFTAPSMLLFSQTDGSSRQFPAAANWTFSRSIPNQKQYFAVGSVGGVRAESEILRVYDAAQLQVDLVRPVSHYSAYESVVSAMSFANQGSMVAFCVRERAVHRLFIADANRLESTLVKVDEFNHRYPWFAAEGENRGSPGITSLAFSPDGQFLVAHGQYDQLLWKFTTWGVRRGADGKLETARMWELENKESPFLVETNSRPIRFIQLEKTAAATGGRQPKIADHGKLIVENGNGYAILDLASRRSIGEIPYLPMQKGLPHRYLSDDGKWLIMGDDQGNVYVWDVVSGKRFPVAYTPGETSPTPPPPPPAKGNRKPAVTPPPPKVQERPAHTGPVVGVTLSAPGRHGDFPEFAATIGEENRLIVWDLIPVLGRQAPPLTAARKPSK